MTVEELKEALLNVPDDAVVMIMHDLIGYEHSVEFIEYDEKRNTVWIREAT